MHVYRQAPATIGLVRKQLTDLEISTRAARRCPRRRRPVGRTPAMEAVAEEDAGTLRACSHATRPFRWKIAAIRWRAKSNFAPTSSSLPLPTPPRLDCTSHTACTSRAYSYRAYYPPPRIPLVRSPPETLPARLTRGCRPARARSRSSHAQQRRLLPTLTKTSFTAPSRGSVERSVR
jgi:hypothetical protein